MDHSHNHDAVDGPWPMGWALALLLGVIASLLSYGLGDLGAAGVALIGLVTFGVFGVLLGAGGVELTVTADHGHGDDHHGHH